MSYLRLLSASAAVAIALALFGPFVWGAAPAMAAGPDSGWHHGEHMRNDNDHFVRRDRDDRHDHDFRFDFEAVPSYAVQPVVSYVQPVSYAVYAPAYTTYTPVYATAYTTTYSAWQSYGPSWDVGLSLAQIQQVCAQYDQAVTMGGAPVNPYVQAVCGSSGLTVYESSGQFYP